MSWKYINGYEGIYKVSDKGDFLSIRSGRSHKGADNGSGYMRVGLWENGSPVYKYIHRLVAEAFIPNPENKPCINHKDGNPANNSADNLEWCTYSENTRHAIDTGLKKWSKKTRKKISKATSGENHGGSKLKEDDVLDIRNAYNLGCFTQKEIAKAYSVDASLISQITNRVLWRHI